MARPQHCLKSAVPAAGLIDTALLGPRPLAPTFSDGRACVHRLRDQLRSAEPND